MGKLLCEKNLRDVWCRNESVRAEIGPILQTHTHTHARARARARVSYSSIDAPQHFERSASRSCSMLWRLGGFGAVVFGNTAELGARGFP